jgi:methionine biosynthesis protein MetW
MNYSEPNVFKRIYSALFGPMLLNDFKSYDEYWTKRGFHEPSRHRAEIISEYIDKGSTILDIGCGDGTVLDYLSKNCSPKDLVGVDLSIKAVEHTEERGYKAYQMDILSDDFKNFLEDQSFDYIIITEVLEHIQNPEDVIQACKGHFNKNLFVSIPNMGFFIHRLRLLFGRAPLVVIQFHVKEHLRFWTHADFLYWCEHLGLSVYKYRVSAPIYPFGIDLGKIWPSLFGMQIIYALKQTGDTGTNKLVQAVDNDIGS